MSNILNTRKEKILEFVYSVEYKRMTIKQIASIFEVPKEDMKLLEKIIANLEEEGKIYIDDSKRICVPNNISKFVCSYEAKSKGFGFALVLNKSENKEDIYISKENSLNAFDKDIVLVELINEKHDSKSREGKIIKILKHEDKIYVGIVKRNNKFGFVEILDNQIQDVYIPQKLLMGTTNEDIVAIKITQYPTKNRKAEGKIIEILGHKDEDNINEKIILKQNNIYEKFSEKVILEAEKVSNENIDNAALRKDLRKENIYTVDPIEAKDLDDAISVKKINDYEYLLSVHIADVSNYVKENSLIDKEAIKRGTSIYLPNKVIPMLPRSLSNGICSLLEGEERYTITVQMKINKKGEVESSDIFKSIICSKKRMTYESVECVLKNENEKVFAEYKPFINDILLMQELSNILRANRFNKGSINLEIPETHFTFNHNNELISIEKYSIGEANKIIEEFMLACNKTVARTFNEISAPFIYRIHEKPDIQKLQELNEILKNMGTSIKAIKRIHPKSIDIMLDRFKGDAERYYIVSKLVLKALKLAKYSEKCLGHFGLNFEYYTHFTSPIRRYPDLFIHRVISNYLDNGFKLDKKDYDRFIKKAYLYSRTSSECEKIAKDTERKFDDLYIAKFMKDYVGEEYFGIISGITNYGMYVKLFNTAEGIITLASLKDDYYIYNEKELCLVGENTNKKYQIGKKLKVRVDRVDITLGQIDFSIVEEKNGGSRNRKKRKE